VRRRVRGVDSRPARRCIPSCAGRGFGAACPWGPLGPANCLLPTRGALQVLPRTNPPRWCRPESAIAVIRPPPSQARL
jgi:hypothetical protein